ncbi:hypothetical protein K1T71_007902 [Dendrolimus kikuchii]|uniref:Uncharacterized protein n=1 Tax=Dendrolimus kikuchii TaxID=765133 RepID=A0ACC1CYI4_9NEOP|nr:hypothetical protein K1T71_007902 [Dendrolimus kikuchii]
MMRGLLIFFAMCTFTVAMVPRDRRAVNDEQTVTPTTKSVQICAENTPCGWSIYKPMTKIIELNIKNTYCDCDISKVCTIYEDNLSANAYVHKCRPPNESGIIIES